MGWDLIKIKILMGFLAGFNGILIIKKIKNRKKKLKDLIVQKEKAKKKNKIEISLTIAIYTFFFVKISKLFFKTLTQQACNVEILEYIRIH